MTFDNNSYARDEEISIDITDVLVHRRPREPNAIPYQTLWRYRYNDLGFPMGKGIFVAKVIHKRVQHWIRIGESISVYHLFNFNFGRSPIYSFENINILVLNHFFSAHVDDFTVVHKSGPILKKELTMSIMKFSFFLFIN